VRDDPRSSPTTAAAGEVIARQNTLEATRAAMHPGCVLCGASNPLGFRLQFTVQPDFSIAATFRCPEALESYPGTVHGGVVSALLDAAMTNVLFSLGVVAVTAELAVRFVAPVRPRMHALLRGALTRTTSHALYHVEADIVQDGVVVARASAKFRATSS